MKKHLKKKIKDFLVAVLLCSLQASVTHAQQSEHITLYGCMASDRHGNGLFSFTTERSGFTPVKLESGLKALGGGTLADHKFFSINADDSQNRRLCVYDADTWTLLGDYPVENPSADLTYDPVNKKVYGCFTEGQTVRLGTIDENGKQTYIAYMNLLPSALFCTQEGQLMIIGQDGVLYKLDKETAQTEKVGETGILPFFVQSATIDPNTGRCYWASMTQDGSALQEVNLATGKAKQIYAFENMEEIVGLFIPVAAKSTAPAKIDTILPQFSNGSLSGKVVFNMPSKTKAGTALTGELAYKLMVNEKVYSGHATAGTQVSVGMTLAEGQYKLVAVTFNDSGEESDRTVKMMWAGMDQPATVTGTKLHKDSPTQVTLSWNASTEGKHRGYISPAEVSYKIVRYPDSLTLQENCKEISLTDSIMPEKLEKYWYGITPLANGKQGEESLSSKVIMGPGRNIPYNESMETKEGFDQYTVEDSNHDGVTWNYNIYGNYVEYSGLKKGDDWLISPPVKLEKDGYYKLSFNVRCNSINAHELAVSAGQLPDVDGMEQQLLPATGYNTEFSDKKVEKKFTVDADGDRYFGFHSTAERGAPVIINHILVERISSVDAPATVSNLKIAADEKGKQSVSVSFNAPAKTIGGDRLTSIDRVELFRRTGETEKLIKTFIGVNPGDPLEMTDNEPELQENTYRIVAYNAKEAGDDTTATVYVGIDIPGKVSNIQLKEVENAVIEVSWKAPEKGIHGGYIDVSKLTYRVKRNGSFLIAGGSTTSLHVTDSITDLGDEQLVVGYEVVAISKTGAGQGGISPFLTVGAPYHVMFKESFANGKSVKGWGSISEQEGMRWSAHPTTEEDSQDRDKGIISLLALVPGNGKTELVSPKIAVEKTIKPKLSFWLRHTAIDKPLKLVAYSADRVQHDMLNIDLTRQSDKWQKIEIDLEQFNKEDFIQIGFQAFDVPERGNIDIDNLLLFDDLQCNLGVSKIIVPQRVRVGEQGAVTVPVSNQGTEKVETFSVNLCDSEDNVVASATGTDIEPWQTQEVKLMVTPQTKDLYEMAVKAVVNCRGDQNLSNNTSMDSKFTVVPLPYPTPLKLAGTKTGADVTLSWIAPDLTKPYKEPTLESFESYPAFTVSDLGEWSLTDADQGEYTMQFRTSDGEWINYENCGGPMAFQLIDLSQITGTEREGWNSASGKKILIAVYTSGGNDDWLISPELYDGGQGVSVCAKSLNFDNYGLESMEILYSETDKQISSFKPLKTVNAIPTQWTEYKFNLPAGAKYFAIHSKNANSALMIDDIQYVKAGTQDVMLNLQGYNVYRDGNRRNDALLNDLVFVDKNVDNNKSYNYFVTAVYERGESDFSNVYRHTGTMGVELVNGQATPATIATQNGQILMSGLNGRQVDIYTIGGMRLCGASGKTSFTVHVSTGVYVIKIGSTSHKVIVK